MSVLNNLHENYIANGNYIKTLFIVLFSLAFLFIVSKFFKQFIKAVKPGEASERSSTSLDEIKNNLFSFIRTQYEDIAKFFRQLPYAKDLKVFTAILFAALGSRFVLYLIGYAGFMLFRNEAPGFWDTLSAYWNRWDSTHYLHIAENWYVNDTDKKLLIVFYPLFPILVKSVSFIVRDYFYSGLIVSNISLVVACFFLYKLVNLDHDDKASFRAVKYMLLFPVSFFFAIAYSESLFIALSIMTFYFMRKKNWFLCGIFGLFAALTRNFGMLLFLPVVIEYIMSVAESRNNKKPQDLMNTIANGLSILFIPLGTFIYLMINKTVSGNWFIFMDYQRDNWNQSLGFFAENLKAYFLNAGSSSTWPANDRISIWIPQIFFLFVAVALLFYGIYKLRTSYSAYMLAYLILCTSPTWLLSGTRYIMCLFPMYILLALLAKNKTVDFLITFSSTILLCFYAVSFATGFGRLV